MARPKDHEFTGLLVERKFPGILQTTPPAASIAKVIRDAKFTSLLRLDYFPN